MSEISTPTPVALTRWPSRAWRVLKEFILDRLESHIFRAAFVTVLFVSAIQQFVGWKYVGVLAREVTAHVQQQVLPWSGSSDAFRITAPAPKVVVLQIGDDFFSGPKDEGFEHTVPLPLEGVVRLLTAVAAKAPAARIVIDFDLAPRSGVPEKDRETLDVWLYKHSDQLLLVEPTWATRNLETLRLQLDWVERLCRAGPYRAKDANDKAGPAIFAQSTLVSRFGLAVDSQPYSGEKRPSWDIGRAVHDHFGKDGARRNPICARFESDAAQLASDPKAIPPLATELLTSSALQIERQPVKSGWLHQDVYLRSEFIRDHADCRPRNFADVGNQACLEEARVVVIGGSWSYGFGDRQDTFVGEKDGAIVHAAWIQSWLKPVHHVSKPFEILLDVIIIESLLHPILKFAFLGMHRRTDAYVVQVRSAEPRPGIGQHVTATVGFLMLAIGAVIVTVFSLIMADGLLRWAFDRSLGLDTAILALVLWSVIAYNGLSDRKQDSQTDHDESFPLGAALRLGAFCLLGVGAVFVLADVQSPKVVRTSVQLVLAGVPLVFLWYALKQPHEPARQPPGRRLWNLLTSFRRTFSGAYALIRRPGEVSLQEVRGRLSDVFGVLVWSAVVVMGVWVFAAAALWGLLIELLGG